MTQKEFARLQAVVGFQVLDTSPEQAFDDIAELAASVCATPIALVSLLDRERQWFKARVGFAPCETNLERSVCRLVVAEGTTIVIPDLVRDPRTRENPLVTGEAAFRFYAGAPLITSDGHVLGSLCVIDQEPRPGGLTAGQRADLERLARQTVAAMEMRRVALEREARQEALLALGDALRDAETAADMTRTAARIVGEALDASRASYGVVDAEVRSVTIEPDWTAQGVASIAGRYRFGDFGRIGDELKRGEALVISDVLTDTRTCDDPAPMLALGIGSLINMPVRERGRTVGVFIVHSVTARTWSEVELTFIRNVADRLEVGIARLRAQEQQDVLNREISHRLKNTLSMVQAVAAQTLRGIAERDVASLLEKRLLALGRAHDVLMQSSWQTADLETLARRVLEAAGIEGRYTASGPSVKLGAKAALSTSLLLHELATNALKYGSLAIADGAVRIAWRVEGERAGCELDLSWVERGGPPAAVPTRRGFGSRLLRGGLLGTGGSAIHYGEEGLSATFRASLEQVEQA